MEWISSSDSTSAQHTFELKKREDITLNLDYRQSGLGGASCGPGTLDQYLVKPDPLSYTVRLTPLCPDTCTLWQLSKQVIEM